MPVGNEGQAEYVGGGFVTVDKSEHVSYLVVVTFFFVDMSAQEEDSN